MKRIGKIAALVVVLMIAGLSVNYALDSKTEVVKVETSADNFGDPVKKKKKSEAKSCCKSKEACSKEKAAKCGSEEKKGCCSKGEPKG